MGKLLGPLDSKIKKLFTWTWDNILFLETLFLLVFIPLFPKIPILDVKNTWVYIRAEDFIVLFVLLSWIALLIKKKITLKTPLTIPILIFWLIGGIATIHGVLLIFPTIANVFPNVAFLSLVRHIEYMSLFFISYQGMKDKRFLPVVISTLVITLLSVIFYGFGQKYLGFPAYLTMNEEFAKGIPIQLSELSRVPSTFAGHYDLAAYLVLIIPIVVSLAFGFKNLLIKAFLLLASLLGFILLFMTVSRVSFFVLLVALLIVFFFQKRRLLLASLPFLVIGGLIFVTTQPSFSTLFERFNKTVSEVDVLVDAKTGASLGHIKFVPKEYFQDKVVLLKRVRDTDEIARSISGTNLAESSSQSAVLQYKFIPKEVPLVNAVNISTGENLSQGTGYINLYLSPVTRKLGYFYYELPPDVKSSPSAQVLVLQGDFIVKRASAYDLSFTTRFQGEWPVAIEAFKRNLFVGSGYGSVSLAVDNNYLRILAEIGLLGFVSFLVIFLTLGIYIKKIYPEIESKIVKSFIVGFSAGVIGLALNATLIDVFEASKIAFLLWMLSGITLAILVLHQKREFSLLSEIREAATSTYAIVLYLFLFCMILFLPIVNGYFVGDDFTWLRWAADCKDKCAPLAQITSYFTDSDGFFYRPGAKLYFHFMYQFFWLNQTVYHLVSLFLHFAVASMFLVLAKKITGNKLLAAGAAFLFLVISGSTEAVFWISSTGHLVNALFGLLSLIFFISWDEKRKLYFYIASFISIFAALMFHELGVVFPLFVLAYKLKEESFAGVMKTIKRLDFLLLFIPVIVYLVMRFAAGSHWFNGDYGYDILKLPFNLVGNALGYVMLTFTGPMSLAFYDILRSILREHLLLALIIIPIGLGLTYLLYRVILKGLNSEEKKLVIFGLSFFFISLIPYIGLGNITSRYSYLPSLGLILVLVLFFKKTYEYLQDSGREIAIGVTAVIIIVFSLFHIIQIQQSYFDWLGAGNKAKNFFVSIDGIYNNYWARGDMEFHFVDVPLKVGNAWVFPVGLEDGVWFAFRNDDAKLFKHLDEESALKIAPLNPSIPILKFNEDGSVTEVMRPYSTSPDLIMPR